LASKQINVAIVGVGNAASVFVQSLYSRNVGGIWHQKIGGFAKDDVKLVAAFDTDDRKVGKDLSEAIFSEPNVSRRFANVKKTGIEVQAGIAADETKRSDIAGVDPKAFGEQLKSSGAHVALNLIPSGLQKMSSEYANASIGAECSFVNATPSIVASDKKISARFASRKLVVVGDDLLSQFGGTAFHKGILDFISSRGVKIEKSYQLDVGGGKETLNTINEEVKLEKRDIKTHSIAAEVPYAIQTVAGTTDYVDYMGNDRTSYFWISGKSFFDSDVKIDIYLRTNDGANAGNVLLDVVRAVAACARRGIYGSPKEICEYGFKKLSKPALLRDAQVAFLEKFGK
jgi:myo-inositol-1-phosphate synthase